MLNKQKGLGSRKQPEIKIQKVRHEGSCNKHVFAEVKVDLHDFSFAEFFMVWANIMFWEVPAFHLEITKFLEDRDNWDNDTGVLQVFRGSAKSTIVGLFIAYSLVKNPKLRFLVLSADSDTASKITHDVTNIVSRHPLAKHLRGRENTWRESSFWVNGADDPRSPSVIAKGIGSNVTGSRADIVLFDDIEVPKNAENEALRAKLRQKISDTVHILVPGGSRLFVGTPHSFESIYPEQIDAGASSLRIPLLTETEGEFPNITGKSIWNDRFTDKEVMTRQLNGRTKANFLSQYQLIPYNADETVFDVIQLQDYKTELNIYTANNETVLSIGKHRMVSCSCYWDPSMGKGLTDDSVISVVFTTANGHYYIHAVQKLVGDAEDQCVQAHSFAVKYHIPQIIIETNGVGVFLPALLRKEVAGTGIAVLGEHTTQKKATKILEAFEVPLSAGYVHCHASVMQSKFFTQLRDFNPVLCGRTKDDFIDSVASCIHAEPVRVTRGIGYGGKKQQWHPNQGSVEVKVGGFSF